MFVSITRLRLRSWRFLFPFFSTNGGSIRQAVSSKGFRSGATLVDRGLTFWTCTVWDSEADMKAFRGSGAHREVMPYLRVWCSEAATTHWSQDTADRPSWPEAHRRLKESPRWHTVDHPGPRQTAHTIPDPATAQWRDRPMS